jgi:hypothetical protein
MLSIIICSRNKELSKEFLSNISKTVGVEYEIIHIDNSNNSYTIFSAYNTGFARSKFDNLCYVHEDVFFNTSDWGQKVINHLKDDNTGIVGLAGGDFITRIPGGWAIQTSPSCNIIQSDKTGKRATRHFIEPLNYPETKRSTITLDGVILCMSRTLMEKIKFDESLIGFHGYDYDISLQSTIAGYQNYVIYDIEIEHFSRGKTDMIFFRNLILIYKKFEKYLPILGSNITENERLNITEIEKKRLLQLIKKMVRKGFSISEIKSEISYYANMIGYPKAVILLPFRIFLIRLFNVPKYLFRN